MAYDTANPPILLASARDGSTPQIWSYYTADSMATVMGSGYFSTANSVGLRVGDHIVVSDNGSGKNPTVVTVASIASGAATVGAQSALTPGAGISNGTGTVFKSWIENDGPIVKTSIYIDLTGLNSGGTAGDVIGVNGAGAAYLGQITAAKNGTIFKGQITCLETPATGDTDIDVYSATEATGVEDTAIGDLTETQLVNSGAFTVGLTDAFTAWPAADSYLYLVGQGTSNATFTAGILLIELWGY